MKIFLSYGHDDYEEITLKLKNDLEKEGYEVWLDKEKIKGSADWEIAIEKGISSADWLVIMMTEHSVRRPDGVCLDEVSFARFLGKKIAPIMIQDVKPPLCIARIQWLDMKGLLNLEYGNFNEDIYKKRRDELLSVLKGSIILFNKGEENDLKKSLLPLDNDVYTEFFRKSFYGRKKLFDLVYRWFKNEDKILWLTGDAGVGKTAFIANLTKNSSEIQAVHFCRYNDNERADPKRAIMSIAYYLSTQLIEYKNQLLKLADLNKLIEKSVDRLFDYLITEPLNKINYSDNSIVIIIDALDEATHEGKNELADIIAKQFIKTPKWLKLIITSRKESTLERKLSKLNPTDFSDPKVNDNEDDIFGFLQEQLVGIIPNDKNGNIILKNITKKSQGIFLYVKTIVEEIKMGRISIDNIDCFPDGLIGIYIDYFDRIFSSNNNILYKDTVRPIMEIVCASCAPLTKEQVCSVLEMDEYDFEEVFEQVSEMFPIKHEVIEPIHKSIVDWLIDAHKSGQYRVSQKKGHIKLAEYYFNKKRRYSDYSLKYLPTHLMFTNSEEMLIDILNDEIFMNKRIEVMGLDSAIRSLLWLLQDLSEKDENITKLILFSETFSKIFAEYRKFLYNTGLYFQLNKCGLYKYLENGNCYESVNGKIGTAYFYYITEHFQKTISYVEDLFKEQKSFANDELAELHNLIALCYRKSVDFEYSKSHFLKAKLLSEQIGENYNRSISVVNLGKIAYHELDWVSADIWNKQSIELLENELRLSADEDYKIAIELFIAEYHRLTAECLIWNNELNRINEELSKAEEIYNRLQNRDRYFVRYLYTSMFRDVLAGKYDFAYNQADYLLSIATSAYDKSQILFYKSIVAYKLGKNDLLESLNSSYQWANSIGAYLEMEECIVLSNIFDNNALGLSHTNCFSNNVAVKNWVLHVEKFLKRLPEEIK